MKLNDSHTMSCEVIEGTDGFTVMDPPSLDIWGEGSGVTVEQAREFAAGILRAADLLERLTARSSLSRTTSTATCCTFGAKSWS